MRGDIYASVTYVPEAARPRDLIVAEQALYGRVTLI
jgi:hypothetical protein